MRRRDQQIATVYSAVLSTTVAYGGSLDLGVPVKDHSVQYSWSSTVNNPTALAVALQGSLNGSKWFTLGTSLASATEITNKAALFHVLNTPVVYVRAAMASCVFATTVGTTPTLTALHLGHNW